jgi:SsrA-binding protein
MNRSSSVTGRAEGNLLKEKKENVKVVSENRKARHDYFIHETYEAGIALTGTEVKSLRSGKANLKDSYARIENGEVMLHNLHISPYEAGNRYNHDPLRIRKLLLHRDEIKRLLGKTREKGLTLIPLRLYFNQRGLVKVELALGQGKKLFDKREDLAERDARREVERTFRDRQRL